MQSKKQHLMQVLIGNNQLLHDFLNILICRFNNPIHLRSVGRRVVMFNLEDFTKFFHHLVVQIWTIVKNNLAWNTMSANDLILDKPEYHVFSHIVVGCHLDPFGEIINDNKNETKSWDQSLLRGVGYTPHILPHCSYNQSISWMWMEYGNLKE